jgi:hypothetical protein
MPISELAVSPDGVQASVAVTGNVPLPVKDAYVEARLDEIAVAIQALVDALTGAPLNVVDVAFAAQHSSAGATTIAQVSVGTTATLVLPANFTRKVVIIQNSNTVPVYLGFGIIPTTTNHNVELGACANYASDGSGGSFVSDVVDGAIYAISPNANGAINVTELT